MHLITYFLTISYLLLQLGGGTIVSMQLQQISVMHVAAAAARRFVVSDSVQL